MIIKPHKNKSERVTNENLHRVMHDKKEMIRLCFAKHGLYDGGFAVAHQQITKKPLRFFVKKTGEVIINPVIVDCKDEVNHLEGCLSFPDREQVEVKRWNSCIVEYQYIDGKKLSEVVSKEISGMEAFIYQHEIEHFDCRYIY